MTETLKHCGIEITIVQDDNPQSPAEYSSGDNGLFLVAGHRDFCVPAPGEKHVRGDFKEYVKEFSKTHWIFPIEAYIHSGICLAISGEGNFPDRAWDVSQAGAIFAAKNEWRLSKSARKSAESLLNEWNQYLSGDVWGYIVDADGENESCWGFRGKEYCIEEAESVAEHIFKRKIKSRLAKIKAWIQNGVPIGKRVFA